MDEVEITLLAMEFSEVLDDKNKELSTTPEWFRIGAGLQPASKAVYDQARVIYLQFINYRATPFCETFEDIVKEFTQAKLVNAI